MLAWERSLQRRSRSAATLETWGVYVRDLGSWLLAEGVDEPGQLTRDHLQRWQDHIRIRLTSKGSQQVTVSAARSILKWADREQFITGALWTWLDRPVVGKDLPRPLDESDLAAILAHYSRPTRDLVRLRDRALFWFLATTGSRISAALGIRVDQLRGHRVIVRQKGGNEHLLVMSAGAREWITDYLDARGRDQVPELWISVGPAGRTPLRDESANRIWTGLSRELGIPRFTSHVLKHTSVTELGEIEASDTRVARHIGWKDPRMMERYRALRGEAQARQVMVDQLDRMIPRPAPELLPPVPRRRRGRHYPPHPGGKPA